jgi:hypothetical protein
MMDLFYCLFHQENVISTPAIKGTILPGITRKSIIEVAHSKGFKVNCSSVSWIHRNCEMNDCLISAL